MNCLNKIKKKNSPICNFCYEKPRRNSLEHRRNQVHIYFWYCWFFNTRSTSFPAYFFFKQKNFNLKNIRSQNFTLAWVLGDLIWFWFCLVPHWLHRTNFTRFLLLITYYEVFFAISIHFQCSFWVCSFFALVKT